MSIEYTIDIQLTELGFPDIVQPRETSGREATGCRSTPSDDKFSASRSPVSISTTHKQSLLVRVQQSVDGKEAKHTSNTETVHCKPINPTPSAQEGYNDTDGHDGDAARKESAEALLGVEDDSDDSDVSEVCEDEELDEEDDYGDEEGLNNESSHSGNYRCGVCDLQLPSKFKLQDHMNLHTGARPYGCAECGKRFCQIYNYRVHLRTHAETKVDRLMCRVCQEGFASQEDLDDHLSTTHFENEFYECDLCKRVFTSLKACENHVQLHKYVLNVTCENCGRNFPSLESLARHRGRRCNRHFKCTDCTLTFTKKIALLKHSFSHLGLLPYTCVRCRCHFRLAKLYRQHRCEPERIHCVACLREFVCRDDFQQHKKDTGCWGNQEPKVDEIRCLECGQTFDTSEELKKHAGAHQRVLKCADCGKGFRSALLLMSHMGGHAGKSPCLCQSCGMGFPHQQNYDSHLKTCGQTPQPARAPKKRPAPKSSSPERKKLSTKPDSSSPTNTVTLPAAPVNDSSSPGLVTEGVSPGSGPADGLWKLTLDKEPPPGVKLVLFFPVCQSQTNGLTLPSAVSPTLPGPAVQVQPQHLGVNAALGAPLIAPLDFVTGLHQDPGCDAPLDLSKKCKSSKSSLSDIPLQPIKSEAEEFEISGESDVTDGQEFQDGDSKAIVKPNPEQTAYTEEKSFEIDPTDLAPIHVKTTSPALLTDIKNEPQSPGLDFELSRSYQQTEKEVKMEVEISNPASADLEKKP